MTLLSEDAGHLLHDIQLSKQTKSTNMVLQYLLNHTASNIYDMAMECYMSESSIVRCIQSVRPLLEKHHLIVERKNDSYSVIGSEYDKRELYASLIYRDAAGSFSDAKQLKSYFGDFNIKDIHTMVDEILEKNKLKMDDIHYNNLIMNLAISLQRALLGFVMEPVSSNFIIQDEDEITKLADEICSALEKQFHVQLLESDHEFIQILCVGSIKPDKYADKHSFLNNDLNLEYKIKQILDKINSNYALSLDYHPYLNSFALHVYRLFFRSKASLYFQNTFTENIKHTHPFVYEIAVYFAYEIKEDFNIEINDDEIGLLAIYLGLMIKSDANEHSRCFQVICVCPEYNDLRKHVSNQLMLHFGDIIHLQEFVSSISNTKNEKVSSTLQLP